MANPELFKKLVVVGGEPGADVFPEGHNFPEWPAIEEALARGDFERLARAYVPCIVSEPGIEELLNYGSKLT